MRTKLTLATGLAAAVAAVAPFGALGFGNPVLVLDGDLATLASAVKNARKLIDEDKVDIILGSSAVAPSIAIAEVADESQTVQLAFSPIELKPGRGAWTYRLAQPVKLMAEAVAERAKANGVKSVAFIGFAVLWVLGIWMLYRIVKGWLYLNDSKPMYANQ